MAKLAQTITAPNSVQYDQPTGLFINNQWVESSNRQTITSINPATEQEIVLVSAATADDVDAAVRAARSAFESDAWQALTSTARGSLLLKLADLVESHQEVLATIETMDNGKPFSSALGDVEEVVSVFRYYGGWADKQHGQTIAASRTKFAYTLREPIGVCGQIIPWNYPIAMASWKLGPALACGNTVVIKAAEATPLSILYLANLVAEAGFPPGVVNIINGYGAEAGSALVAHPDVDKIAFTGSTLVGKQIMKLASTGLKNITLETGGKSPILIFDDAQLENAVKWAHYGVMGNMGQICTATARILVHENIYTAFVGRFLEYLAKVSIIGDPFEAETYHGPQVSRQQFEKILGYVQSAKDEGATVLTGGAVADSRPGNRGFYIAPTVLGNVQEHMKVYREEVFGPVATLVRFSSEDEAIRMSNDTEYGLAAAVCTSEVTRAHRVAGKLRAGTVWINSNQNTDIRVPFGGFKQSGIGYELGQMGLDAYSNLKAVHVNLALQSSL
ncbi:aldehyde dehydrogenase [Aspergillus pseudodeflectus]|uniref:aldehyde dehydrogenase (NAD(+)) n=1 Tax=Aspergillus pseudodeflectus TaxID=176178 RepID=A0ABR4L3A9_9EURO